MSHLLIHDGEIYNARIFGKQSPGREKADSARNTLRKLPALFERRLRAAYIIGVVEGT